MTKHDQFRFYQLATILVAVYIGFIVLVNLVIAQQQDAMLKERGADYALIIKQPQFDRQKWLRQNGLQVLTPKSPNKTKLQKAVTDIVNRNHSAANFSTRQTVNKQPYLFYAHQADRPNFVLVVPQQQFWHTWPKIALSVTIVYLIGSWIFLYRFWRQRRHFFDT